MGRSNRRQVVGALLERHGTTFAEEAGIRLGTDPKPSPLYRLLCLATLISAPIRTEAAVEATRGLSTARWRTARAMANSTSSSTWPWTTMRRCGSGPAPTELSVGVVTAVIGAPFLLWLLARANRIGRGG